MPVKPFRVAVGASILAALFLFAVYRAHPLPRFVARTLGVHEGELAKLGGLRMTWLPPGGFDTRSLMDHLYARAEGGSMGVDHDAIVIVIPGVSEADVPATAERITSAGDGAGLAFREVVQTEAIQQLPGAEIDQWHDDERGELHIDHYLFAPTREEIEAKLAEAAKAGWTLPSGTHIAYGRVEATDTQPAGFRTYVVKDEAELDGWSVTGAEKSFNQLTNRPEILVDFDEQGARRFAEVTERLIGRKLAIMVRGEVRSAPIINSAIRGGRAAITMGGTDPVAAERDADALLSTLDYGALPPGGRLVEARFLPPTGNPLLLWLARALLALLGGAFAGGLVWLVVRWAQPTTRPRRAWAGEGPWVRVLVSLAAPGAILLVSRIGIYGTDREELVGFGGRRLAEVVTIGSIGIMPVITAYMLVEIVAALIWARRRHAGPMARRPIDLAVAIAALALVAMQGWFFAQYLHAAGFINPGVMPRILVVASLAGGTAILVATAAVVRWQGLGNGYGALFAGGWLVVMLHRWVAGPLFSAEHVVGGITMLAIAVSIGVVLRWRVGQLRVPTSSIAPLADAGGIVAVLALLAQFPLDALTAKVFDWSQHLHDHASLLVVLVIVLTIVWSLAFGRPPAYAGQPAPSWATWQRATTVSMVLLVGLAVVVVATGSLVPSAAWMADAVTLAVVVAYALDAYDDFQARRAKLVVAWTLHQPHHADAAEQALADAGIPSHMSASHLRALLSFFGPFCPIEVLVPADHATTARDKLAALVPQ